MFNGCYFGDLKGRWLEHVEHKDDTDWIKRCPTMEVEGVMLTGRGISPCLPGGATEP